MKIEVVVDVKTTLGEGPLWDVEQQRLYWIDAAGMRVFRATAQGSEIRAWDVPSRVGSIAIRKDGKGAICSLAKGFHALDFETGECPLIAEIEPDRPTNWINDGKVDRRGRFFAGTMDSQEAGPFGALYRLDPDFTVTQVETGIIVSNGPCWSPEDKTFYFADSWSGELWAYDYDVDNGTISNRRTFAKVDRSKGGAADGSTVDAEGCLWNAHVYD
ncbi:MAG TPA: SMP-30/gluconolactonase/LRE family protein, partial [Planctomycetia bacterium]|nr:SMP-30/gluconolactonase/LRE family protein [Planctomycetia bacterium]